jgi:hypothetical protein
MPQLRYAGSGGAGCAIIWRGFIMIRLVSFIALAALISISPVGAAQKNPQVATAGSTSAARAAALVKKRGNAAWVPSAPGCRMAGKC